MALTEEEEQRLRDLLAKEDAQEKRKIRESIEQFKEWLKENFPQILQKITRAILEELFRSLLRQYLL